LSAFFIVLFATAVGWVTPPAEARMNLNGDYAATSSRSCTVQTTGPFAPDPASGAPTVITGSVFRQNSADSLSFTFNANGTGSITGGVARTMNISATAPGGTIYSVSVNQFPTPFTYVINPDDTVDLSLGVTTSTTVSGSGTGNTVTVSPRLVRLKLGSGGNTLVSGQGTGIEQEAITVTTPANVTFTWWRICTRSTTLVRE
jgi:hypothetical protein